MTPRKDEEYNKNWEAEIAAYDAECAAEDKEFAEKFVVFNGSGNPDLTEEENAIFVQVLRGIPISEIAEQAGVDEGDIVGLVEIIRAKLSLSE